jgi:hypothetical protein
VAKWAGAFVIVVTIAAVLAGLIAYGPAPWNWIALVMAVAVAIFLFALSWRSMGARTLTAESPCRRLASLVPHDSLNKPFERSRFPRQHFLVRLVELGQAYDLKLDAGVAPG